MPPNLHVNKKTDDDEDDDPRLSIWATFYACALPFNLIPHAWMKNNFGFPFKFGQRSSVNICIISLSGISLPSVHMTVPFPP